MIPDEDSFEQFDTTPLWDFIQSQYHIITTETITPLPYLTKPDEDSFDQFDITPVWDFIRTVTQFLVQMVKWLSSAK